MIKEEKIKIFGLIFLIAGIIEAIVMILAMAGVIKESAWTRQPGTHFIIGCLFIGWGWKMLKTGALK